MGLLETGGLALMEACGLGLLRGCIAQGCVAPDPIRQLAGPHWPPSIAS